MRFAFLIAAALLAGVSSNAAQQTARDAPIFRSASTELVVLPVVVTDKQGRFVSDLPRERFAVYDNGRRQEISLFTNEDVPVSVGLVIDSSGSMGPKLPYVQAATLAFSRLSNPDDEIFAVAFNDSVREVLPGRPLLAANVQELERALTTLVPVGQTALYDALITGLDRLGAGTRARKILVLISDGGDNVSRARLKDVLVRARKSNAAIYTIGLFDELDADQNPGVLKSLASETGGVRFLPKSAGPMLQACERIAREIRNAYTLAYVPPDRDGTYHAVRIQLEPSGRPRLTIRTRPGYFAAGTAIRQ